MKLVVRDTAGIKVVINTNRHTTDGSKLCFAV